MLLDSASVDAIGFAVGLSAVQVPPSVSAFGSQAAQFHLSGRLGRRAEPVVAPCTRLRTDRRDSPAPACRARIAWQFSMHLAGPLEIDTRMKLGILQTDRFDKQS